MPARAATGRKPMNAPDDPFELPLLQVTQLAKTYRLPRQNLLAPAPEVQALAGVSFTLRAGSKSLGVVGESGSGKSTLARLVMALEAPSAGQVRLRGVDLHTLPPVELRRARGDFQMVFQDPYGSLDLRRTVLQTSSRWPCCRVPARPARRRRRSTGRGGFARGGSGQVPARVFSGGQRQRIARALITRPS